MADRKTLVIDLDGTICTQTNDGSYLDVAPVKDVIDKINGLWMAGWDIVIFTARGMKRFHGNSVQCDTIFRGHTERWLQENRVCYTKLLFGKPSADIYVDDKGLSIDEFIAGEHPPLGE